jgi:catechol 2,3-dioxygenase-like lactoylglutathione lyase family enzyme
MIETYGLTHISLAVADPERSMRFYAQVFGAREYFRDESSIQAQGPGPHDVLGFERDSAHAGNKGGIGHFGFRLRDAAHIDAAVEEVKRAGGTVQKRGEFRPGFPYAYVLDPDGYLIEIWYE